MPKSDKQLLYDITGCIFNVYYDLGPGLLEKCYEHALQLELESKGFKVERQVCCPIYYKGNKLDENLRIDLLVEDRIIVELKSVENLLPLFYKQTYTYLRLSKLNRGILVNFNTDNIRADTHWLDASEYRFGNGSDRV